MGKGLRVFFVCLGLAAIAGVALVAGGGVYRTANAGKGEVWVVNRFTGSSRLLSPDADRARRLRPLPPEVLDAIEAEAELWDGEQGLSIDLYNGSTWDVRELVVLFDAVFEDGTEMHRRLAPPCALAPLTSGSAWCDVGFSWSEKPLKEWNWRIESGRGIRE